MKEGEEKENDVLFIPDGLVKYIAIRDDIAVYKTQYKVVKERLRKALHDADFKKVKFISDEDGEKYFSEKDDKIYRDTEDKEGYKGLYEKYKKQLIDNVMKIEHTYKYNEFYLQELLINIKSDWMNTKSKWKILKLHIPEGFVKFIAIDNNSTLEKRQYEEFKELLRDALHDNFGLRVEYISDKTDETDEKKNRTFGEKEGYIYRIETDEEEYKKIYKKQYDKCIEAIRNDITELKNSDLINMVNLLIETKICWHKTRNKQSNNKYDMIQDI